MMVIVTGAAGGLGRAMACECARRGYSLLLTDINEVQIEDIRLGISRRYSVDVYAKACDLTNDESVKKLFAYIACLGKTPDMLLNIAGVDYEGSFLSRNSERINDIVQLNIAATLRVTHAMLERKKDRPLYIVNVSSLASIYPIPLKATYAASKRFLLDFSIALGQELKHDNVRVMALCPGGLATTKEALAGISSQGFWGSATTNRLETVARRTISRALSGRRVYIPGALNRTFSIAGRLVPGTWIARLLHSRWQAAQKKWLTENKA
jgi:short-subunit dehydrogenase